MEYFAIVDSDETAVADFATFAGGELLDANSRIKRGAANDLVVCEKCHTFTLQ